MTITCRNCQRRVEGNPAQTHWIWLDDGSDVVNRSAGETARELVLLCSDECWGEMAVPHLTGLVVEPA